MSNSSEPTFEHEATLEELAGVGKNRRFDELVDDEEVDTIQVICKRGGEEIPLARPSRAFYFGDRKLYDQEAKRFDQAEKARILNVDRFDRNLPRFEELKRSCQRGFVVPFIGAGMSKSAGCPTWKEYLLNLCKPAKLDKGAMLERLEQKGDYEGAMNDLVIALGDARFNRDFESDFKTKDDISGAVTLLPRLFDGPVITTNFDRVLETVYTRNGNGFVEKVTGRGQANAFFRAIPAGERYLLKLHGNLDNAAERVLNKAEYDVAYGADGNVSFTNPLPRVLKRLYCSYGFLFVGCSLVADRTLQTFMRVAGEEADCLPHHYAILEAPSDAASQDRLDAVIAQAHISPIWFPAAEFETVEEILSLLLE